MENRKTGCVATVGRRRFSGMGHRTSSFLRGVASVVGIYQQLPRPARPSTQTRNPWAADAKAIRGDFEKAVGMEATTALRHEQHKDR
jgi:hypothetical protein